MLVLISINVSVVAELLVFKWYINRSKSLGKQAKKLKDFFANGA